MFADLHAVLLYVTTNCCSCSKKKRGAVGCRWEPLERRQIIYTEKCFSRCGGGGGGRRCIDTNNSSLLRRHIKNQTSRTAADRGAIQGIIYILIHIYIYREHKPYRRGTARRIVLPRRQTRAQERTAVAASAGGSFTTVVLLSLTWERR